MRRDFGGREDAGECLARVHGTSRMEEKYSAMLDEV